MEPDTLTEDKALELRVLMQMTWGDVPLADQDRLLALFSRVRDPYHSVAFGRLSLVARMMIVADHQMEAGQWKDAYRTMVAIDRIERRRPPPPFQVPDGFVAPNGSVAPDAPAIHPAPPPPATARDREAARRQAQRDQSAVSGRPIVPPPSAAPPRPIGGPTPSPSHVTAAHPPFT